MAEESPLDESPKESPLMQNEPLSWFLSLGSGPWTVVREFVLNDHLNFGIFCALGSPDRRNEYLETTGWNLLASSHGPGFSQHSENGEWVTTYNQGWTEDGVEPFVLEREFHGVQDDYVEIQQEFRLFHNLAVDKQTGNLVKFNADGTQELAVKFESGRVSVRTKLIKQYIAARQLDFHLYFESVVHGESQEPLPEHRTIRDELTHLELFNSKDSMVPDPPFTLLTGKRIIPPGPVSTCGVWPYDEDEHFPEFTIGEDEHGRPVSFTCDPDQLANYFGKNPDAPHYLTPVHFRKEVLQKYYDNPELYSVTDGSLRCASLWSCRIDNDYHDRVVVFLGDIGRDLPSTERDYWRGFMITPDVKMSETNYRRSFLGQFAEPKSADLIFGRRYDDTNKAWAERYGWPLFRAPEGPDAQLLKRLRIPLNDSQSEFESSIRILTQVLVDSLNEEAIKAALTGKQRDERGIAKFERLLAQEGYPTLGDIKLLRRLQELRSKITAHRKGSDYEEVLTKNLGTLRGREAIASLMEETLDFLTRIDTWVHTESPAE